MPVTAFHAPNGESEQPDLYGPITLAVGRVQRISIALIIIQPVHSELP